MNNRELLSKFEKIRSHSVDGNMSGGERMELCKKMIIRWIYMEDAGRKKEIQKWKSNGR